MVSYHHIDRKVGDKIVVVETVQKGLKGQEKLSRGRLLSVCFQSDEDTFGVKETEGKAWSEWPNSVLDRKAILDDPLTSTSSNHTSEAKGNGREYRFTVATSDDIVKTTSLCGGDFVNHNVIASRDTRL
jgi:hypothetical protein